MNASTLTAPDAPQTAPEALRPARRPGTATVLRWEITKLAAQARSRYTLLGCVLGPIAIVLIFNGQQTTPSDTIYGRQIHTSGYAMPLFLLAFASQWIFPVLASLVAGDIFANEDQHGTWKTILTRSVSRSQIFWAKTVTAIMFTIAEIVVLAATTIVASMLLIGTQPLSGLSGQPLASAHALQLVIASWATALPPLIGFTTLAILLSVVTRNPSAGVAAPVVLGLVMGLLGTIGGFDLTRRFLLTTPLDSWHGLLTEPPFYGPLTFGLGVSAAWTVVCLGFAFFSLRRRDITGG
ncbi:ABC transporter permease [Actinacidiphila paucisporea]|uniref:ABC-2 type transport system permease protein n=1 Tax=Actinacidiphila paucisporea TaxID=310782 RepID=A0A1M7QH82_9ACTN|nr:ABC transporter permease [Actinacidiphila paucisporea]SHN30501.1 ABC-2 type transport system permease protein [Actinacidiphila paucisporea]